MVLSIPYAALCANRFLAFPLGSLGFWGKFNDAAKSILFEIPRDVGRVSERSEIVPGRCL